MLQRVPSLRLSLLAALALTAIACNQETYSSITDSTGTAVELHLRSSELKGPKCSDVPGGFHSYVATLRDCTQVFDTENPGPAFTFPSSLPTPCSQGVQFEDIAGGHLYAIEIDGYEQFATELGPPGWFINEGMKKGQIDYVALRSGARQMTTADGTPVTPRWQTSCGEGSNGECSADQAIVASDSRNTLITGCGTLVDSTPGASETAVAVAPQDSLGALRCAYEAGPGEASVASFALYSPDGLGNLLGIPCQAEPFVQKLAGAGVSPGKTLEFFVDAYPEGSSDAVWGATCTAVVEEGLTVRAACTPLSDLGSVHIDISALLAQVGVTCSGDIASYDAQLSAGDITLKKTALPCTSDVTFGPLEAGDYEAQIAIHAKDGVTLFATTCSATVLPGRITDADCILK